MECAVSDNKATFDEQMKRAVSVMYYIFSLEKQSEIIAAGCCAFNYGREEAKRIVGATCGAGTVEYMESIVNKMTNDLHDMVCGVFPDTKACYTKAPEIMGKIVEVATPPIDIEINLEKIVEDALKFGQNLSDKFVTD